MELFSEAGRALRATEISHAMALNHSATVQILKTLVDAGYLLFNSEDKGYHPSPRVVKFGMWVTDRYYGDSRIDQILDELCEGTGAYTALFARNDIYMQVIDIRVPAGQASSAEIGLRVPLFGSACGAVLLAETPSAQVEGLMERARVPVSDQAELLDGLQQVRREGYAFGGLSPDDEVRSIAICLPLSAARIPLVVCLGGPAARIEPRRPELVSTMKQVIEQRFR